MYLVPFGRDVAESRPMACMHWTKTLTQGKEEHLRIFKKVSEFISIWAYPECIRLLVQFSLLFKITNNCEINSF